MGMDDVRCPENYQGIGISWEVKIRKKLPTSITKWFKQAENNVYKKNLPILAMKEKGTRWGDAFVMMKYEDFLRYFIYFYMEKK